MHVRSDDVTLPGTIRSPTPLHQQPGTLVSSPPTRHVHPDMLRPGVGHGSPGLVLLERCLGPRKALTPILMPRLDTRLNRVPNHRLKAHARRRDGSPREEDASWSKGTAVNVPMRGDVIALASWVPVRRQLLLVVAVQQCIQVAAGRNFEPMLPGRLPIVTNLKVHPRLKSTPSTERNRFATTEGPHVGLANIVSAGT